MKRAITKASSLVILLGASVALGQGPFPLGTEFQVNSYTTSYQFLPAVAADLEGNFVAIWASGGSDGGDTSSWSVQGQRYRGLNALFADGFELGDTGRWSATVP